MSNLLKGNFSTEKAVVGASNNNESLEQRLEKEALKKTRRQHRLCGKTGSAMRQRRKITGRLMDTQHMDDAAMIANPPQMATNIRLANGVSESH